MGREIRKIAADFEWPLNKTWEGFLNPHYEYNKQCPFCEGSGYNPETHKIYNEWYWGTEENWVMITANRRYNNSAWSHHITQDEVQALVNSNRLMDFTHTWTGKDGWVKKDPPYTPTADEVNEWSIQNPMGHDSLNAHICVETRAKRLGVWGQCEACKGHGSIWSDKKHEDAAEKWEPTDPPTGDYYQLWETTSEGSPISPPCETPEKLARWLADNEASSFGSQTESYDTWLEFVRGPGWAPSAIGVVGEGIKSGVKGVVNQ